MPLPFALGQHPWVAVQPRMKAAGKLRCDIFKSSFAVELIARIMTQSLGIKPIMIREYIIEMVGFIGRLGDAASLAAYPIAVGYAGFVSSFRGPWTNNSGISQRARSSITLHKQVITA